jgi:chromosome segregation ATPase
MPTATMKTTKKKTAPRRRATRGAAEGSDVGGLALFASALGNVLQASRNSDLTREKERLLAVVRAWQGALHRASAQLMDVRREVHLLRQANSTLAEQVGELERERALLEAKYAEAVKELGKAKGSTDPTEVAQ